MIINYDKKNCKVASSNHSKLMEEAKLEELTNRISNIEEDESTVRFPPIHQSEGMFPPIYENQVRFPPIHEV